MIELKAGSDYGWKSYSSRRILSMDSWVKKAKYKLQSMVHPG